MTSQTSDPIIAAAEPHTALICGGPFGIAARLIGSVPRQLEAREVAALRRVLNAGYSVEIVTRDYETLQLIKPGIFEQLGYRFDTVVLDEPVQAPGRSA